MAGLQPRSQPSGSGPDGPSGIIITGEERPNTLRGCIQRVVNAAIETNEAKSPEHKEYISRSILSFFPNVSAADLDPRDRFSVIEPDDKSDKGKDVDRSDAEPARVEAPKSLIKKIDRSFWGKKTVPHPESCARRDVSKMQHYARTGPAPVIKPASRPSGLRSKSGDARRWQAPSASVSSSGSGSASDPIVIEGLRPGRSVVGERAPEFASVSNPTDVALLRSEGRQVPDEYGTIEPGEDDGYGPCPMAEEAEEINDDEVGPEGECMDEGLELRSDGEEEGALPEFRTDRTNFFIERHNCIITKPHWTKIQKQFYINEVKEQKLANAEYY